jgi:hypothetical protein
MKQALELQWALVRITALAGGGEAPGLVDDNGNNDFFHVELRKSRTKK